MQRLPSINVGLPIIKDWSKPSALSIHAVSRKLQALICSMNPALAMFAHA
ncbi:hypothetical protein [Pseudoxanthomonas mexicana]